MRQIIASTIMLSSMLFPAAAFASSSADANAPTQNLRVSTGVMAPSLEQSISLQLPEGLTQSFIPMDGKVGLSLTVDGKGQPKDIKVVKSLSPYWDARVVQALQSSHFRPGTVDNTPIPVEVNLTVEITH